MKSTAIICAALAGTLGFGSIASAQEWHRGDRDNHEQWQQRREQREHQWQRERRVEERHFNRGWSQPRYVVNQPRYAYGYGGHRYYRGGYLPREYLNGGYYVSNWNAYPGLYAPPYGYQWVNVDGDFLLVALATGLIANALMR